MHFVCVVQNPTKRLTAKPTFSMDLLIHGSQLYSAILFKWSVYLPTPQLLYPPRAISGVSDPETGPAMCATTFWDPLWQHCDLPSLYPSLYLFLLMCFLSAKLVHIRDVQHVTPPFFTHFVRRVNCNSNSVPVGNSRPFCIYLFFCLRTLAVDTSRLTTGSLICLILFSVYSWFSRGNRETQPLSVYTKSSPPPPFRV